jgi:murein L,D-transpeptidase YafK
MTEDDQKTFIELLKDANKEQYKHERSKHPCTRKKKKAPKVKHGNRKKK